ncbi:MAG: HAMP domain-containing histidine kinase, partial [Bacteroidetes bacterium]|nr:HAMP domain-containing histidine kinase [Bacteroidota bacterium]
FPEKGEYHIAVKKLPNYDEPLYLLYDVSDLEWTEKLKFEIKAVLITMVLMIIGLGFWIGLLTARKVIAPVVHLAEQVNKSGPENLPTNLSKSFFNDEVGVLAKALEQAMQRVKAFVDREHQFTRDASHELRTPVTVIKGALELLKKQSNIKNRSTYRPLHRIERSVTNMENIIETFLWLAREEEKIDPSQTCIVIPAVKKAIEQHKHLFMEKPVEIKVIAKGNPVLNAPAAVFQLAITNLVQNAFHYTKEGEINVYIGDDRVTVTDTGQGIAACDLPIVIQPYVHGKNSSGFGLGLAIVKRLCNRFGWLLEIESEVGKGTKVQLIFQPQ